MAYNYLACDRDQAFLLPPDVRDWLPSDHLAWFVLDVVDQLDLGPFLKVWGDAGVLQPGRERVPEVVRPRKADGAASDPSPTQTGH
jgi:hypothetical protein